MGDGDFFQVDIASHNLSGGWWSDGHPSDGDGTPWTPYCILMPTLDCPPGLVGLAGNALDTFSIARSAKAARRAASDIYILNLASGQTACSCWGCPSWLRRPRSCVTVLLWSMSFVPVAPLAIYSDVECSSGICTSVCLEPAFVWHAAFIVYTFALGFALPFALILCYVMLLVRLKTPSVQGSDSSEKRITCVVVAIVLGFAVCWLPFYLINICFLFVPLTDSFPIQRLFEFTVTLSYAISCLNPILYICLLESFWRRFRVTLCPQCTNEEEAGGDSEGRSADTWAERFPVDPIQR